MCPTFNMLHNKVSFGVLLLTASLCADNFPVDLSGSDCDARDGYFLKDRVSTITLFHKRQYNTKVTRVRDRCDVTVTSQSGTRIRYTIDNIKIDECGIEITIYHILGSDAERVITCSDNDKTLQGTSRYNRLRIKVRRLKFTLRSRHFSFNMVLREDTRAVREQNSGFSVLSGEDSCDYFRNPKSEFIQKGIEYILDFPLSNEQYKNDQSCVWHFSTESGYVLTFNLLKSHIQGKNVQDECGNDYVDIFDDERWQGRFCSLDSNFKFTSSGPKLKVLFFSDSRYKYDGFEASISSAIPEGDHSNVDTHLAVTIPVAIVLLLIVIIFTLIFCRHYRRKVNERAASQQRTLATASRTSTSSPAAGTHAFVAEDMSSGYPMASASQHLNTENLTPSAPQQYSPSPGGYNDPPPAYDAVAYSPIENAPLSPPSYDEAVKQSDRDSSSS